ncbi:hypothetical protein PDM84_27570 [Bacillus cereus]|nr:hypothetical protein [Bacillus cereus]
MNKIKIDFFEELISAHNTGLIVGNGFSMNFDSCFSNIYGCLKEGSYALSKNGIYIVVDSLKGKIKKYSQERLYKENNRLQDAQFQWENFKIGKFHYWDHPWGLHPVKKHVKEQYDKKKAYLKEGIIKQEVPHTSGEMIVIEKL